MADLVFYDPHRVEIEDSNKQKLGTFLEMNCDKHGDTIIFTDPTGSDWCVECVETMIKTRGEIKPHGK